MKTSRWAGLAIAALVLGAGAAGGQEVGPFRVEWQSRGDGDGRAVVSGYVHNGQARRAERIRLRVEALDAASRPVAARTAYVSGTVGPQDRGFFEVGVTAAAGGYRVTVEAFDWAMCGDG